MVHLVPACTLQLCTVSIAYGNSSLSILVLLRSIMPTLLVLYDRVHPSIFGTNSHLRALRRDVRSRSHTYLVYWYCCIPSCLHSSCCTTAYALVQSRTCKHSFMLYDLVHRGILLHKSLHSKTVPCMASCCTPRTPARLCCTSTYATV